jgi:hypothetical protein
MVFWRSEGNFLPLSVLRFLQSGIHRCLPNATALENLGTINNLFPSLANNSGVGPGLSLTLASTAHDNHSEGFNLSLSQQMAIGGTNSDEVVLYSYGIDSNGVGVETVSMADDSAQSAYQSMMASINGFGDLGNMGTGGIATDV